MKLLRNFSACLSNAIIIIIIRYFHRMTYKKQQNIYNDSGYNDCEHGAWAETSNFRKIKEDPPKVGLCSVIFHNLALSGWTILAV